mgnify:CR=1 FL=1
MITVFWPFLFFGLLIGLPLGDLTRKLAVEEKMSKSALDENYKILVANLNNECEISKHLRDIQERTQDYPALKMAKTQLQREITRLNMEAATCQNHQSELEKKNASLDKELLKARAKIRRLEKRTSAEKSIDDE